MLQSEVAAQIGAHTLSVTNWEKGHSEPEIRYLPAIIWFLGHDPRPAPETIGERLVRYRQARGLSQKRLASELNVDPMQFAQPCRRLSDAEWSSLAHKIARISDRAGVIGKTPTRRSRNQDVKSKSTKLRHRLVKWPAPVMLTTIHNLAWASDGM